MRCAVAVLVALLALPARAGKSEQKEREKENKGYRGRVSDFREEREKRLASEDGWLTVSGLYWLKAGENRFGSDSLNDMVLPAAAPERCGSFDYRDGKVTLRMLPDVEATIDGEEVNTAVQMKPDDTKLILGRLTLLVHASGGRLGIRLKDKDSDLRKKFRGLTWYPIREKWRITGRWVKYGQPKTLEVSNMMGDMVQTTLPGYVDFVVEGKSVQLDAEQEKDGSLSIVFSDLTAGKETYAAARFLDADAPGDDGLVTLDFNKAYNPPCAYNKYTTCPLPPPGNKLELRVEAGEKLYKGAH